MPFARSFPASSTLSFGIKVKICLFRVLCLEFWRRLCDEDFPDPTTAHLTDEIRCTCAQETGRAALPPLETAAHSGIRLQRKEKIKKLNATRGLPRRSPILVLLSPKHV